MLSFGEEEGTTIYHSMRQPGQSLADLFRVPSRQYELPPQKTPEVTMIEKRRGRRVVQIGCDGTNDKKMRELGVEVVVNLGSSMTEAIFKFPDGCRFDEVTCYVLPDDNGNEFLCIKELEQDGSPKFFSSYQDLSEEIIRLRNLPKSVE